MSGFVCVQYGIFICMAVWENMLNVVVAELENKKVLAKIWGFLYPNELSRQFFLFLM